MRDKETPTLGKNGLAAGLSAKSSKSSLIGEGNIDKVFKGAAANRTGSTTTNQIQEQINIERIAFEKSQVREYHRLMHGHLANQNMHGFQQAQVQALMHSNFLETLKAEVRALLDTDPEPQEVSFVPKNLQVQKDAENSMEHPSELWSEQEQFSRRPLVLTYIEDFMDIEKIKKMLMHHHTQAVERRNMMLSMRITEDTKKQMQYSPESQ